MHRVPEVQALPSSQTEQYDVLGLPVATPESQTDDKKTFIIHIKEGTKEDKKEFYTFRLVIEENKREDGKTWSYVFRVNVLGDTESAGVSDDYNESQADEDKLQERLQYLFSHHP